MISCARLLGNAAPFSCIYAVAAGAGVAAGASSFLGSTAGVAVGSAGATAGAVHQSAKESLIFSIFYSIERHLSWPLIREHKWLYEIMDDLKVLYQVFPRS